MEPAPTGVSGLQQGYSARSPRWACWCDGPADRVRECCQSDDSSGGGKGAEMALRVSIGAGRWRLVQMVLVESAMLAFLAAASGALFAWWSAPFVISMINPPDNPARLVLPADWRVLGFGMALTLGVIVLFGFLPALRASSVKPASVFKGGDDPHSRRRLMQGMVARR